MNKGDIVLVPFPFTDLSVSKLRPALIIYHNEKEKDFIVLAITSQKGAKEIELKNSDLENGILPVKSYIRYTKIATLHEKIITRRVASLKSEKFKTILKTLQREMMS